MRKSLDYSLLTEESVKSFESRYINH